MHRETFTFMSDDTLVNVLNILIDPLSLILEIFLICVFIAVLLAYMKRKIKRTIEEDENVVCIKRALLDNDTVAELDTQFPDSETISTIHSKYGIDVEDRLDHLIDKSRKLLEKAKNTRQTLSILLHACELGQVNKDDIKQNVNAAGGFLLYAEREITITHHLLIRLEEKDPDYRPYLEIMNEIRFDFMHVDKRTIALCLALISECS